MVINKSNKNPVKVSLKANAPSSVPVKHSENDWPSLKAALVSEDFESNNSNSVTFSKINLQNVPIDLTNQSQENQVIF